LNARKASAVMTDMSREEEKWIETAIPKLIYQMGVYVSGLIPNRLEMGNLPPL
jgi:hypothetical protein